MPTFKVVVIGASGVGKTSLRGQYISSRFSTSYRATIGADFITKTLPAPPSAPDESITLQIWDTAGQERFSSLASAFFRGADAAILMYDVTAPDTLYALRKWWDEFKDKAPVRDEEMAGFCVAVVGNKVD
ncbi:small GTPase superfamily, partial [Mycena albidolilacea]